MSWLFGMNKGQGGSQLPPGFPPPPGSGGDSGDKGGKPTDKSRSDAYSFDSAALERAAQAAKTLEHSGKYVLQIIKHTEYVLLND